MRRYVLMFAFSKDLSEVALILKNRPANQAGLFNGIGGKIEENEDCREACVRKFIEEAGLITNILDWSDGGSIMSINYGIDVFCNNDIDLGKLKTVTDEEIFILPVDALKGMNNLLVKDTLWFIEGYIKRMKSYDRFTSTS